MSKQTISQLQEDNRLKITSAEEEFPGKNQPYYPLFRPRLACQVNIHEDYIILSRNSRDFAYQTSSRSSESLQQLFFLMDGTRNLEELQQIFSPNHPEVVETIIHSLAEQGLLDNATQLWVNSGSDALEELDNLTQDFLTKSFDSNPLWKSLKSTDSNLPVNILYGFALEQYQLLSRKSFFYAPVLSYPCSGKIRQLIDELYHQESAQEKLLLEALNIIGISDRELIDTIPLSETMAMCHALAYWANSEPLFCCYVLGIIKARETYNWQAYTEAFERAQLETEFLTPIRKLTRLNLENKQKNLNHLLWQEMLHLDEKTKQRFSGQIYLFIEIYNNFYTSIWNYYWR